MRIYLLAPLILSACTSIPVLDGTLSDAARDAPYPTLTPLPLTPAIHDAPDVVLQNRIAALNARAETLRKIDITALQ